MHWIHNDFQHIRLGFAWNTVFVTQTKRISLFPLRTNQVMFCQSLKTEFMLVKTHSICVQILGWLSIWFRGCGFRKFNFDLLFWDSGFRGFNFDLLFGFSFGDSVKTASNAWDSVFRDRIRTKHMFCNTNTMNYYII